MKKNQSPVTFLMMATLLLNAVQQTFADDQDDQRNWQRNHNSFFSDFYDLAPFSKAVLIGLLTYMGSLLACAFACQYMKIKREDREERQCRGSMNDLRNTLRKW